MAETSRGRPPGVTTKHTVAELREKVRKLELDNEKLKEQLKERGNVVWCYMCDEQKDIGQFYVSTNPVIKSRVSCICKDCARKIALRASAGVEREPTKESVIAALRYLDKPFLSSLWESSLYESTAENIGKKKNNAWTSYIKNVQMPNYYGMTFADSDFFKMITIDDHKDFDAKKKELEASDAYTDFEKNRKDVIRLLSYDPFENESPEDQPLLYSQLLGLLDASEDANDDMMRTASCISIVRAFLQQSKIDDATAKMMGDYTTISRNMATIKSMQDSKKSLTMTISSLAKDNCISLQYNKGNRKGENTWTGKIKKIRELNLREGEVNGFDMETCRGMRQVMDASHRSLLEQLKLDESEYGEIIASQRDMVVKANRERDEYKELNRIILRENLDLRDTLREIGILNEKNLVDLDDLYSPYSNSEGLDDGEKED